MMRCQGLVNAVRLLLQYYGTVLKRSRSIILS